MTETVREWMNMEQDNMGWPEEIPAILEQGILKAIFAKLRRGLKESNKAECTLPWGTYKAERKQVGEAANINVSWDPSKGFMKYLNGDTSDKATEECLQQDEFDPEFMKLLINLVAWRVEDPEDPKYKGKEIKKGIMLDQAEVEYVLNSYAKLLATMAKKKQRDGNIYRLEIKSHPHGDFNFRYTDDEISVTWVADKVLKTSLKDDASAQAMTEANFTRITEVQKIVIPTEDELIDELKAA